MLTSGTFGGGVFTFTDEMTADFRQRFHRIISL
jgi:hypothetical protein